MGGCFSFRQAAGGSRSPVPMPDDSWPEFDLAGVEGLVDTPKVIERSMVTLDQLRGPWKQMGPKGVDIAKSWVTDDLLYSQIDDHGLVRVWKDRRDGDLNPTVLDDGTPRVSDFDQNASYLTGPTARLRAEYERIDREIGKKKPRVSLASAIYGFAPTGVEAEWQLNDGLRMAVPEIIPENAEGLIVHITGLYETKYEHRLTNRLRSFGYASAYLESATFLTSPKAIDRRVRRAQRTKWIEDQQNEDQRKQSRFDLPAEFTKKTQSQFERRADVYMASLRELFDQAYEEFPSIESGFQIYPDTDLESLGNQIAQAADDMIAEHAYAVEALVRATDELHPLLTNKPIVVLGYSAGALVSPAVAARLQLAFPNRPIRLILIGGGGDLLSTVVESSFGSGLLRLKPKNGPEPTSDQIDELKESYLANSRLDPLVLAPAIRDVPTLHLYASKDTMVPTAVAKMFNAAHGHVDELRHWGNHGTLFYFASGEAGKIRSWLNKQDDQ